MVDPELRDEVRRYLRQRLEAGETERLTVAPSGPSPGRGETVSEAGLDTPAPVETGREAARAAVSDSLERIAAEVQACTRCRLSETRKNAVPGVGPTNADVVFIGEGPGAEEDNQGKPFVGPAGQLLTKIIESVKFRRDEVFITNIVKCRPPQNRDPQPDEVAACEPYLKRQLEVLQPKVICALGRHAGSWLAGAPETMGALRNGIRTYEGIRVFPTYHPAALLRNPQWKRPVWEDIQKVRAEYDRLAGES
jgi:uracil-DNA glycosylase family 4